LGDKSNPDKQRGLNCLPIGGTVVLVIDNLQFHLQWVILMVREDGSGRGAGGGWFSTTHWSVVLAAGEQSSSRAQAALEQLCDTYWFPLYAYVRRQGRIPEDAQDLTQEFFARFLNQDHLGRANPQRGRFRTFLLSSYQNFLRQEWQRNRAQKRGGDGFAISWDEESAEARYQLEISPQLTPDQVFDQRWAMALFRNALARLQQEAVDKGRSAQFEQLKEFLSAEPGEGKYAEIATCLGMSAGAVAVAVHRLRQRYGELVREEVAHTVTTPTEVDEEMRYLIKLIGS
jgi:RNA polymerase sigma-70 factor (ECF subfamily)